MADRAVLGLDAGTTTAKSVVVDQTGEVLASAESEPIATLRPEPGAAEQEPGDLSRALEQACRAVTERIGPETTIAAVSIAAQSGSVVGIGPDDRPVTRFVTWMDTRAEPTVAAWTDDERHLIRSVSGWSPSAGLGLASVRWLRSTRPDLARCPRWASVDDLLVHELTGTWATNSSNAAGMQLIAVASGSWDHRLCGLAGIEPDRLSPIRPSGEIVGGVTSATAARTGLGAGTPVVIGGHDQTCSAFALGAITPGRIVVSAGTAWVVTAVTDRADVDGLPTALNLSPHVVPGLWTTSQNLGGLGRVLDWWRQQAHGPDPDPSLIEDDLAAAAGDGPIFVPETGGDTGMGHGRFETVGARPDPAGEARAQRTRAVLESAIFEVRRALEAVSSAGMATSHLTFVGGGSRSPGLRQLLADVTGLRVTAPGDASWPALGAAGLAARALGWQLPDLESDRAITAEPTRGRAIESRYEAYLRLVQGGPR